MKKIKPILYSTPMVIAIDEDRKTQTRRLIKSKHESGLFRVAKNHAGEVTEITSLDWDEKPYNDNTNDIKPKYNIGDILWVRETWQHNADFMSRRRIPFIFKTDYPNINVKWKPSIFMPKEAARFFLEVTKVRVERLQDISEEDAIAEGLYSQNFTGWGDEPHLPQFTEPTVYRANKNRDWSEYAIGEFQYIWNSINGNWDENPFVFVYDFKRIDKPEDF